MCFLKHKNGYFKTALLKNAVIFFFHSLCNKSLKPICQQIKKLEIVYFFKLKILFFEFILFDENQKKLSKLDKQ